jgi:hypothetical protein
MTLPPEQPPPSPRRSRPISVRKIVVTVLVLLSLYLLLAYILSPWLWHRYALRHPALQNLPTITHTGAGIHGDPLNLALTGSKDELVSAMLISGWHPADRLTFESSARIAIDTVLRRPYEDAPVSNLYLFGRKEDLAFEQPFGNDPKRRHHVRFWLSNTLDSDGRPIWVGAATFDTRVGFSHTTGQITHHIAPDIDTERDHVMQTLNSAGRLSELAWIDDFQKLREGRNGGGDPYHTDGKLAAGVLVSQTPASPTSRP